MLLVIRIMVILGGRAFSKLCIWILFLNITFMKFIVSIGMGVTKKGYNGALGCSNVLFHDLGARYAQFVNIYQPMNSVILQ